MSNLISNNNSVLFTDEDNRSLGTRLRYLRKKQKYTVKEVSQKLGISTKTYTFYEKDKRKPLLDTLVKLSELYHVSMDFIVKGVEM